MHTLISLSDQSDCDNFFFKFEYMSNRIIWIPQLKVYLEFRKHFFVFVNADYIDQLKKNCTRSFKKY